MSCSGVGCWSELGWEFSQLVAISLGGPDWADVWHLRSRWGFRAHFDLRGILDRAKISKIDDLLNKPVEGVFNADGRLVEWRILHEVL